MLLVHHNACIHRTRMIDVYDNHILWLLVCVMEMVWKVSYFSLFFLLNNCPLFLLRVITYGFKVWHYGHQIWRYNKTDKCGIKSNHSENLLLQNVSIFYDYCIQFLLADFKLVINQYWFFLMSSPFITSFSLLVEVLAISLLCMW